LIILSLRKQKGRNFKISWMPYINLKPPSLSGSLLPKQMRREMLLRLLMPAIALWMGAGSLRLL
jgi:hypothetical protein